MPGYFAPKPAKKGKKSKSMRLNKSMKKSMRKPKRGKSMKKKNPKSRRRK